MATRIMRYVGSQEESLAAYGVDPTTDPWDLSLFMDFASASLDAPSDPAAIFQGSEHIAPYFLTKGPYMPSGNIVLPFEPDAIGWWLKWAFGTHAVTGPTGAFNDYVHTFKCDDSPHYSFTCGIGKDEFEHRFTGCQINQLVIAMDRDGFVLVTPDIIAKLDNDYLAIKSETFTVQTLTQARYLHAAHGSLTLDGDTLVVLSTTVTLNNNLVVERGMVPGSRHLSRLCPVGSRKVSMDVEVTFESKEELSRFWGTDVANTPTDIATYACVLTLDSGDLIDVGEAPTYKLVITIPKGYYQQVVQQPSGRDPLTQTIHIVGTYDATHTELEAVLTNSTATYTDVA